MTTTDLLRSEQVAAHLAKGYALGQGGAEEVTDREWIGRAGGGVYHRAATWLDMSPPCWAGAATSTVPCSGRARWRPCSSLYLPHPAVPGMGLGFFRHDANGHRVVGHEDTARIQLGNPVGSR